MATKLFTALLVCAMLASTAQASDALNAFEDFLSSPGYDTGVLLLFFQLWAFTSPFLRGPLEVVMNWIWNKGTASFEVDGTSLTLKYSTLLSAIGIGSYD